VSLAALAAPDQGEQDAERRGRLGHMDDALAQRTCGGHHAQDVPRVLEPRTAHEVGAPAGATATVVEDPHTHVSGGQGLLVAAGDAQHPVAVGLEPPYGGGQRLVRVHGLVGLGSQLRDRGMLGEQQA
jgi:hypothetical protein